MSQASVNIAQQFLDGQVVPADLVGQDAASKTYVDSELAERDQAITNAVSANSATDAKVDTHIADNTVHVTPSEKSTYNAHIVNELIHLSTSDRTKLDSVQNGAQPNQNAFAQVNNLVASSPSGQFYIVGGIGITVTTNQITGEVTITATGQATPGPHASTHVTGGTDVIPDAVTGGNSGLMSGADAQFVRVDGETKTGAQAKVDALDTTVTALLADIAEDYIRSPGYATTAGTATAYTVSLTPTPTTLPDGFGITIVPHVNNGANPTLKIGSLAALPLKSQSGEAFAAGKLISGKPYTFRKVGSDFLADSGSGSGGDAQPQHVLAPHTFSNENGEQVGTMIDRGETNLNASFSGTAFIPEGYYNGLGRVLPPPVVPGNTQVFGRSEEKYTPNTTYTTLRTANITIGGTYRISFSLKAYAQSGAEARGRIYKNGVAVGAERITTSSTYTVYTEDMQLNVGDTVEFKVRANITGYNSFIANVEFSVSPLTYGTIT